MGMSPSADIGFGYTDHNEEFECDRDEVEEAIEEFGCQLIQDGFDGTGGYSLIVGVWRPKREGRKYLSGSWGGVETFDALPEIGRKDRENLEKAADAIGFPKGKGPSWLLSVSYG